jgi:subtilase family serine protease
MARKNRNATRSNQLIEALESRQLLSSSAVNITINSDVLINAAASKSSTTIEGYTPAEIRAAYGITGTGAGQTIAIVDAYSDPNIASDLAVFDKEFGLSTASFTQESATGSTTKLPAENADWDGEISLDVEWAHAIAPSAKIILVDASSDSLSGLMSAVEYARTISGVSVVSMSWGSSEFASETSYDQYFTTPSGHVNITFVAASGDDGASGGADWPASSPDVVSVGGTTLSLSSTGTIESESAWSDSEGGVSEYESTPTYQSAVSSSGRSTPDVSYDANPDTGFAVYDSVSDDGYVGWQEVGGTSAGTPQWAAIIADADATRVASGLSTLTSTQTLSELYSIYSNSTSYAADFNDITSGSSVLSEGGGGFGGGGFGGPFGGGRFGGGRQTEYVYATTGYDTLTGLGTPKAAALEKALATTTVSKSSVTKTSTSSTTTTKATKAKAAAVLEVNQVASVFGVASNAGSTSATAQRAETELEVDATASTTVAATADAAGANKFILPTSILAMNRPVVPLEETQGVPAAGDPDAEAINTVFANASASARALADRAAIEMSQMGAQVFAAASEITDIPAPLSERAVERDFRDALNNVGKAFATPPVKPSHQPSSSSSGVLLAEAAMAADAVLLGYFHMKRKRKQSGEVVFSDQPMT